MSEMMKALVIEKKR